MDNLSTAEHFRLTHSSCQLYILNNIYSSYSLFMWAFFMWSFSYDIRTAYKKNSIIRYFQYYVVHVNKLTPTIVFSDVFGTVAAEINIFCNFRHDPSFHHV